MTFTLKNGTGNTMQTIAYHHPYCKAQKNSYLLTKADTWTVKENR